MDSRKGGWKTCMGVQVWEGVPVGGVMCWLQLLAVVLVCAGMLVKTEEADPICVAVGICLGCS